MSSYMYPYGKIPTPAPACIWYASWTTANSTVVWSQTMPSFVPDGVSSWIVGVVDNDDVTGDAVPLTSGSPKRMPPAIALTATSEETFVTAFDGWATPLRNLDLSMPSAP